MLKDLVNSIFLSTSERLKNPFVGSFIIALLLLNWKVILIVLFSDLNMIDRISYVSQNFIQIETYLILPFSIALIYTLILPYLSWGINYLVAKAKKNHISSFYSEEEFKVQKPLKLERLKADSNELKDLNEQISELKDSNTEKDKLLKDLRKIYDDLKIKYQKDYNTNSREMLDENFHNFMEDSEYRDLIENLKKAGENNQNFYIDREKTKNNQGIQWLVDTGIITEDPSLSNSREFKLILTKKGHQLYNIYFNKVNNKISYRS